MANHIQAIHVLKGKLRLTDDDYRALLRTLTRTVATPEGKASSKDMTAIEQQRVRDHLQGLVDRMQGPTRRPGHRRTPAQFAQAKAAASPRERKVWALWLQLGRDGLIRDTSSKALNAWVERTVQVSALGFANGPQLDKLIEALKSWKSRGAPNA